MYIAAIGEIFLKGNKRTFFLNHLLKNISEGLKIERKNVNFISNRIIINEDTNEKGLGRIPGIIFYAKAEECSFEDIGKTALSLVEDEKTFRISAQRLVKSYKSSQEINEEIGGVILEKHPELKVKLRNPELEVFIEIGKSKAFVYKNKKGGLGGLPVGPSGEIFLRVDDEVRSTVAGFLLLKRGLVLSTSKELKELKKFEVGFKIEVTKEKDVVATDETFETLELEKEEKFVLKPLIAFSDEEINELYNKIKGL